MLEPLKRISSNVEQAWQQVAEGWRDLMARSKNALTRYTHGRASGDEGSAPWLPLTPSWGLVAGEIEQDDAAIHVRIELPGMDKKDLEIDVHEDTLVVRGEKRLVRESKQGSFTLMERSYGRFERSFALPSLVDGDRAAAKYRDGVLTVSLPKRRPGGGRLKIS